MKEGWRSEGRPVLLPSTTSGRGFLPVSLLAHPSYPSKLSLIAAATLPCGPPGEMPCVMLCRHPSPLLQPHQPCLESRNGNACVREGAAGA